MSKSTLRRLATNAEGIARAQGINRGRKENAEEIRSLQKINSELIDALKGMVLMHGDIYCYDQGECMHCKRARTAISNAKEIGLAP